MAAVKKGAGKWKPALKSALNGTAESNKTALRERAAFLVAEDKISDELIAAEVGIGKRTLETWKGQAGFKARVAQIVKEISDRLLAKGVADKQNRINAYNDRWHRMQEVIRQRAKAYASVKVGGSTGLIVKQTKGIGKGEDFQVIEEYAVDTGLLRELREHEKQAAIEVGDWTEKSDVKHSGTVETTLILPKVDERS